MNFTYEYERPALTVDIIIFTLIEDKLNVLLIQRKNNPYKDKWAFPGGFVDSKENIKNAAIRELKEETNINVSDLYEFKVFGNYGRDPRGWTVTVSYIYFLKNNINIKAQSDAKNISFFEIDKLPELAFDHNNIIKEVIYDLEKILFSSNISKSLLNDIFSIKEIKKIYEKILNKNYSISEFKNKIFSFNIIGKKEKSLYTFKL